MNSAPSSLNTQAFYDQLYSAETYASEEFARDARRDLADFVREYGLEQARTLDIGCGRGLYQDVVPDWTGVDISWQAAGAIAADKRFYVASADELPFPAQSFDLIWSITFLEHAPDPETALKEMIRVLKVGGILYLAPAWRVPPWRPRGYEVTPYSHLGLAGKVTKALLPLLNTLWTRAPYRLPSRLVREIEFSLSRHRPSVLRYTPFTPNFEQFLLPDSDACASIDNHATLLWFLSRGFSPLNSVSTRARVVLPSGPLILQRET